MKQVQAEARLILDPVHDRRHALRDDPFARESLVFVVQLPKEQIAAFVYTWVNGESKAGAAFCVDGPAVGPEAIFEVADGIAVSKGQGFDDWRVGGAHIRQGEALQTVDVTFAGQRASLEYHFEATHPAYAYGAHRDGCPPWFADDRFEQSGRVRGVLRVGDRDIPFDTMGHRDHSWGTRDWGAAQNWKWLVAQAGPELAVHVYEAQAFGRTIVRGYVHRDGRMAEVTAAEVDFEQDAQMFHTSVTAVVHDDAGRTTTVRGKVFAMYEFHPSPIATMLEGSLTVEIDGAPGVGHLEMAWPKAYLEYMRGRVINK